MFSEPGFVDIEIANAAHDSVIDEIYRLQHELEQSEKEVTELRKYINKFKWQPIETAPKDGTPILGYNVALDSYAVVIFKDYGYIQSFELLEPGSFAEDMEWIPTHWMPIDFFYTLEKVTYEL